ncbi:MAG: cation-translocating P-type ATPase [Methanocella sp.]
MAGPGEEYRGLTSAQVSELLKETGPNELPSEKKRTFLNLLAEAMTEPMFLLLIAAGVLYLALGDAGEAAMLMGFVVFVIGITVFQERKVERALTALRDMSSPRALVIRDGEQKRIPGRDVVPGDVALLDEGDRVPADAVLLSCRNMLVDESLLTGEAIPVRKVAGDRKAAIVRPGGDDLSFVYSGTLVVQGHGTALVLQTGARSEIGKIGKALQRVSPEETPMRRDASRLVMVFAAGGIALCAAVTVITGLTRGDWLLSILTGLTLAMALVPEEIPVVMTIFLALGAWRMSRHDVLTRRLSAVQALGSVTVVCVDKTGTLTMNRMAVRRLCTANECAEADGELSSLTGPFTGLIGTAIMASRREPTDPMERALRALGRRCLPQAQYDLPGWEIVREYPLSSRLFAMANIWRVPGSSDYLAAAKGAPEAVFGLCRTGDTERRRLEADMAGMARAGMRVIAVACTRYPQGALPDDLRAFGFRLTGLVGFEDPVRPQVPESVRECYRAGIRVIMITGDFPATAKAVAAQAGIRPGEVITGAELDAMSDQELRQRIGAITVFARVVPEQKLRIVDALKHDGEVVLMTGDGVNDAPALKGAAVGIAMGGRGTEVAREAAGIVILDDDFSSIVQAIRTGRRIIDNLRKAIDFIFAVHVPIAGMALLPAVLVWPIMLFPAHVAFLQLIIDPACSVAFEAELEDRDIMRRPPQRVDRPLFDIPAVVFSVLQGLVVLLIVAMIFFGTPAMGYTDSEARAMAFSALVTADIGLILTNRSRNRTAIELLSARNDAMFWVALIAMVFLFAALYLPPLTSVFKFSPLSMGDLAISLVAGIASVVWFEVLKVAARAVTAMKKKKALTSASLTGRRL